MKPTATRGWARRRRRKTDHPCSGPNQCIRRSSRVTDCGCSWRASAGAGCRRTATTCGWRISARAKNCSRACWPGKLRGRNLPGATAPSFCPGGDGCRQRHDQEPRPEVHAAVGRKTGGEGKRHAPLPLRRGRDAMPPLPAPGPDRAGKLTRYFTKASANSCTGMDSSLVRSAKRAMSDAALSLP
jgi:hypothetical protein